MDERRYPFAALEERIDVPNPTAMIRLLKISQTTLARYRRDGVT